MKQRLIILSGLPGSGKTKYADYILKHDKNAIRLSKSDIRNMLFSSMEWQGIQKEKIVLLTHLELLKFLLNCGKNIILDDINLNQENIDLYNNIKEVSDGSVEISHISMDVSVEKCIETDSQNQNPIGRETILQLARTHGLIKPEKQFVIYGLDDTIAVTNMRRDLCSNRMTGEFDQEAFDSSEFLHYDEINEDVVNKLYEDYNRGYEIIIVSARKEKLRKETESWLDTNNIPFAKLILKPDVDNSSEEDYKCRVFRNAFYDIMLCRRVVDNGSNVVKMWKKEGVVVHEILGKEEVSHGGSNI